MKVQNMHGRTGREVANQFIIIDDEGRHWFQSYQTIIAVKGLDGVVWLDRNYWDYSATTSKYRNQFLNETKGETEGKIKESVYKLTTLN